MHAKIWATTKETGVTQQKIDQAKVMLGVWRMIPYAIKRQDMVVHNTAMLTFDSYLPAEMLAEKVLDQVFRKQDLVSLERRIEDIVNQIPEKFARVLQLYYKEKQSADAIAEAVECDERTVWRKLAVGLKAFAAEMHKADINTFTYNQMRREHSFIQKEHERVQSRRD
ncbi:MAG: hypothetical protein FWE38_02320 [Firmicutes bacterium]|nr:hypothetical protein [Bacillota bacterium]